MHLQKIKGIFKKASFIDDIILVFTVSNIEGTQNVLYDFWDFGIHLTDK